MSVIFKEIQKFRQWWLVALLLFLIGLAVWAFVQQIIFGIPFGDNPTSDTGLYVMVAFMLLLPIVMFKMNLTTEVREDGLYVRYWPFHLRFKKMEFTDSKAVTYRPIWDYGGWGIKRGVKGWTYNVSGNRGVELTLKNGKNHMIGSQKPVELADALKSISKS